jgi:adenosylcobinamide kinase/adenosylcobinamide-phosphate guanylyltransferase
MSKIIFITGGARSGKSSFALKKALSIKGRRAFIATARALDEEMKQRIELHREQRRGEWDTFEEPLRIIETLKTIRTSYEVIIIDCLTMWVSNLMMEDKERKMENGKWKREIEKFIDCLKDLNNLSLFIISNEVGMGIVPDNEMARRFRDIAGTLNQKVAEVADEVYLMVSGIAVRIK